MSHPTHDFFLQQAIDLATSNVLSHQGGPFAAVVVKEGQVLVTAVNQVTALLDPTAHAEVQAIRAACRKLQRFQLTDCILYSSCEPCPMCLSALYWARIQAVYFAGTRQDAAAAGFDDEYLYHQLALSPNERSLRCEHRSAPTVQQPFALWKEHTQRIPY